MKEWNGEAMTEIILKPGDILFARGDSWLSSQILKATQDKGELPTLVSHVGVVCEGGTLEEATIIEAAGLKTRYVSLKDTYLDSHSLIAVARMNEFNNSEILKIIDTAKQYIGTTYGFMKLPLYLMDSWVGRLFKMKNTPVFFRKVVFRDKLQICSRLVAVSYMSAGYAFGKEGVFVTPDDIYDHVFYQTYGTPNPMGWEWLLGPKLELLSNYL